MIAGTANLCCSGYAFGDQSVGRCFAIHLILYVHIWKNQDTISNEPALPLTAHEGADVGYLLADLLQR